MVSKNFTDLNVFGRYDFNVGGWAIWNMYGRMSGLGRRCCLSSYGDESNGLCGRRLWNWKFRYKISCYCAIYNRLIKST